MEFPTLGKRCTEPTCQKLDFLPMKCDACENIYCNEHYFYSNHNCPSSYKRDVQVPICPLCNVPVPVPRDQLPDIAVGAHIDNDCQADPAKTRRKAYTNKCSSKGCKIKEIVPVLCNECGLNFCLKHRHVTDHNCEGKAAAQRRKIAEAALARQKAKPTPNPTTSNIRSVQGNLSEDEALAKAIALSMEANNSQQQSDLEIARALQESERRRASQRTVRTEMRERCELS